MFENAKWIWKSKDYTQNSYGWFFKYIDINDQIVESILNITAHNHFKLIINGKLISGLVTPAPSTIDKDKRFLVYDISKYLKIGRNKIEVIVLYLGGSGQNYINGKPGFIAEGFVKMQDAQFRIVSDERFMVYSKIPYIDGMQFQQSRSITPVQMFDDHIDLNESNAHPAIQLESYDNYRKQEIPEGHVHENIEPMLVHTYDGISVYDCGEIISGFVTIKIKPQKDELITIRYSEDLEQERVKYNVANEYSADYKDMFNVKKNKYVVLKADFSYKAFRYFEVESSNKDIDVTAQKAGTAIQFLGKLDSKSNDEINDLFTMFVKTQKNNILGLLVDCPHREQAQYLGDSALQAESIIYNIQERKVLLEKVIDDFSYAQYEDGSFPFVAPGHTDKEGRFSLKIPEYDLYFVELVYMRYLIDFDITIYIKYEPNLILLLDRYIQQIDETGLVFKNKAWHISDWPYPTVDQNGDYLAFENMLLYKSLWMFNQMTTSQTYKNRYNEIANKLKYQINKKFKVKGLYKDCENSQNYHQGIQAYALSADLLEEHEIEPLLNYIVEQKMGSSIILGRTVLEMLFKYQRTEAALAYIFDYDKGWGNILRQNSLTMWEGFDDIESHSHAWGMYPIRFIQTYALGISFDKKTKNRVYINPQISSRIINLSGDVVTEKGILNFGYTQKSHAIEFHYNVPKGVFVEFNYKNYTKILEGNDTFEVSIADA